MYGHKDQTKRSAAKSTKRLTAIHSQPGSRLTLGTEIPGVPEPRTLVTAGINIPSCDSRVDETIDKRKSSIGALADKRPWATSAEHYHTAKGATGAEPKSPGNKRYPPETVLENTLSNKAAYNRADRDAEAYAQTRAWRLPEDTTDRRTSTCPPPSRTRTNLDSATGNNLEEGNSTGLPDDTVRSPPLRAAEKAPRHLQAHFPCESLLEIGGETRNHYSQFKQYFAKKGRHTEAASQLNNQNANKRGYPPPTAGTTTHVPCEHFKSKEEFWRRHRHYSTEQRAAQTWKGPVRESIIQFGQPTSLYSEQARINALRVKEPPVVPNVAPKQDGVTNHPELTSDGKTTVQDSEQVEIAASSFLAVCDPNTYCDGGHVTRKHGPTRRVLCMCSSAGVSSVAIDQHTGHCLDCCIPTSKDADNHDALEPEAPLSFETPTFSGTLHDQAYTCRVEAPETRPDNQLPLSELQHQALKASSRNAEKHTRARLSAGKIDHMYAAVDSGANVHTVKTQDLLHPKSVEPSDIVIGGLGADVDTSTKGTVAGILRPSGQRDKKLKFRITDSHVCEGSTVNLLSMSRLLDQDITFIFESNRPGGSFMKLPCGTKIPLIPHNGLFLLKIEDIVTKDTDHESASEFYGMFAAAVQEERSQGIQRAKRYNLRNPHTKEAQAVAYSVAADLNTWHERLGHIDHEAIRIIYESDTVDHFDLVGSAKHNRQCSCPTCRMSKSFKVHPPKKATKPITPREMAPLNTVHTDIRHVGRESLTGSKYMVTFTDDSTRHTAAFFIRHKSDSAASFKEYLAYARRKGRVVKTIISDSGGEYFKKHKTAGQTLTVDPQLLSAFEKVCYENDVEHVTTPAGHSDLNPIAERTGKKIFDIANAIMYHARASVLFWEEAARHAVTLVNRLPLTFHNKHWDGKSAYELIELKKPSFARLRVWGCDAYARIRDGPLKSEPGRPHGRKLIYLGESQDGKSFRCFNPETRKVVHEFDLVFVESMADRTNALREYDARMHKSRKDREADETYFYSDYEDETGNQDLRNLFDGPINQDGDILPSPDAQDRGSVDHASPLPRTDRGRTGTGDSTGLPDDVTVRSPPLRSTGEIVQPTSDPPGAEDTEAPRNIDDHHDHEHMDNVDQVPVQAEHLLNRSSDPHPDVTGTDASSSDQISLDGHLHTIAKDMKEAEATGPLSEGNIRRYASIEDNENQFHVRPLRIQARGKLQKPEQADRLFLAHAERDNFDIKMAPNPKVKKTMSRLRYDRIQDAESISQYYSMATAHIDPEDTHKYRAALSKARKDFTWEYSRGYILFPGRENTHSAHYCDYVKVNRDSDLAAQVSHQPILSIKGPSGHVATEEIKKESFHDLIKHVVPIQEHSKWLGSREHSRAFGASCFKRFMARSTVDLSTHIAPKGYFAEDPMLNSSLVEPNQYRDVRNSPDRKHWEQAMEEELATLNKMGTFEMIPQELLPPNANIVDCRYVYKVKYNSKGEIARYKARLVARGFTQRPGIDYDETEVYAPVCSYESLRTVLSAAAAKDYEIICADIKNAYLIGELSTPVFMRQPPGPRQERDAQGRPKVLKLHRPLYGLKNSGHIFAGVLHTFLKDEYGLQPTTGDRCFFRMRVNDDYLYVLTYVDDLTIVGPKHVTDPFMEKLRKRFVLQESETGDIDLILSMVVRRNRATRSLTINQEHAITKLAKSLGITEKVPSVKTPMKVTPLTKLTEPPSVQFGYLNAVGSLLHIAQVSRPDIAYAVGSLSRHAATFGPEHIKAVKRCVQYLFNTKDLCIRYSGDKGSNEPVAYEAGRHPLQEQPGIDITKAFVDADYAMDIPTRRSTSGIIVFMNGGPISWSSRLQKVTAQSTAEAEIHAATELVKELVHLKLLLNEIGLRGNEPIPVHEDNQACILMGNGMKSSRTAKHYEVRLRLLQESIQGKVIKFQYCTTEDQIADAFTKPLDEEKFAKFRTLFLYDPSLP